MADTRRRIAAVALILVSVLPLSGCYTWHAYQVGGEEGREAGNQPGTEWRSATRHSFVWGLVRQDLAIDNCRLGSGQRLHIEEFKVETNFLYVLAATVSLGLWVPVEISWRCAKPPVTTGTLR